MYFFRGKKHRNKDISDQTGCGNKTDDQPSDTATGKGCLYDTATGSCREDEPESEAVVLSLKHQIRWLEAHLVEKVKPLLFTLLFIRIAIN